MTKVNQNNGNKQKQTFFHGAYSNLTLYLFLPKYIEVIQWLSKSKFFNGMTKWTQNMKMKQNQTFFCWTYSNLPIFLYQNILKYLSDFQNQNFSILWVKSTQAMGMKSSLTLSLIGRKILKYFNDFFNWNFSISLKKWAQSSKLK